VWLQHVRAQAQASFYAATTHRVLRELHFDRVRRQCNIWQLYFLDWSMFINNAFYMRIIPHVFTYLHLPSAALLLCEA
jgi:hypothetical protein